MRILCVISSLTSGGAEHVMADMVSRWSENHEMHLLTLSGRDRDFYPVSDKVVRHTLEISSRRIWNLMAQARLLGGLRGTAKAIKPDLVISFINKTNVYTALALGDSGIPLVLSERTLINRTDIPSYVNRLRKWLYPKAFRLTVLTPAIKEELLATYPKCKAERIVVLPNPVEKPDPRPAARPLRELLGLDGDTPVALSAGRLIPLKSFSLLLETMGFLKKEGCPLRLVIFGEGPERVRLEEKIRERGLEDRVFLPGRTIDLSAYHAQADLFLTSSIMEGFGMAVIEALASGTPVLGFDAPGVRNLVQSGRTGILVPHGDCEGLAREISLFLRDQTLKDSMSAAAPSVLEEYSLERIDKLWNDEILSPLALVASAQPASSED